MQNVLDHISDRRSHITGKRRKKFSVFGLWWLSYCPKLRRHSNSRRIGFVHICTKVEATWSGTLCSAPMCGITSRFAYQTGLTLTFSASTLLAGRQKEHPACINWLMRCWSGYLSGARCRLFAYGPADATAIPKPHRLLPRLNPDWFYLFGTGLTRLSWKSSRSQTQLLVSEWSVGLWS